MSSMNKTILTYIGLVVIAIFSLLLGIAIGTVNISLIEVLKVLVNNSLHVETFKEVEGMHENIIWNIRLPRVLVAGLVVAALSIVGAAFQGLLRNPLADPYTLG